VSQPRVKVGGRGVPAADRIFVGLFAGEPVTEHLPAVLRRALAPVVRRRDWRGTAGEVRRLQLAAGRGLTLSGLGAREGFDARALSRHLDSAASEAIASGCRSLAVVLPEHDLSRGESGGSLAARALALAGYRFDRYRSKAKPTSLAAVTIVPPSGAGPRFRRGVETGAVVARATRTARDLGNTPPNEATPQWMASRARELARRAGARVSVLGVPELRRRRMGGILAVGAGSTNPPRLVRIELGRGPRTIALVGKGVTFDTGGISIKPASQMDEMKWDKSGSCTVLGILEALVELDLPLRVRAYLPFAENMPDGAAYRPGDIVRISNGKTVEILNTDAEGRMLLADALSWASSERPDAILEFSTLTGACVVALGHTGAGLFTPDDALAGELADAAAECGERIWRLPLWGEFLEEMRGAHADLRNSGGRWGGASTAAAFLSQFVGDVTRWAHLDIAGPAYVGEGRERRGATGFGIATVVEWLRREAARGARRSR